METPEFIASFPYIQVTPSFMQVRMGLIGAPGTGKTTAALTFPNAIVLDEDNKCPPGVNNVPLWDPEVCRKWVTVKSKIDYGPRNGLIDFLKTEGPKFPKDSTLIHDSWTSTMNKLDGWQDANKVSIYWSAKKNEVDGFALHGDRLAMAVELSNAYKALKCNVIICIHEQIERDKDGNALSSIKPLMKGQFADQMAAHLTAFFRQLHSPKWSGNNGYYWKVKADDVFKPITPHGFVVPELGCIDATYEAYRKQFKV